MANLLESMLSGGEVKRQDNRHLNITKRPMPQRPRQLLELFGAMGTTATFPGLMRALSPRTADPHQLVFVALGRWPSLEEIAAFPEPYQAAPHLQSLLRSEEFRAHLVRRTCEAFPERKRLLFVRIARSGGGGVLEGLRNRHPLLPLDLTAKRFDNVARLVETLGQVFARTESTNTLAIVHKRMSVFLDQSSQAGQPQEGKADGLAWHAVTPPCRVEDTLFTVLREPRARALGQINALLRAWQGGEQAVPVAIRARIGGRPARAGIGEWRQLGRDILAETVLANPICHALGDGTAEGARQACARSPIQLVQLEQISLWSRSALENMAADSVAAGEPILRRQDLGPGELDALGAATAQDQVFYDRFIGLLKAKQLPELRGRDMA